jgi:hypothetical protein
MSRTKMSGCWFVSPGTRFSAELANTMSPIKRWMRTIYAGQTRVLGPRMPFEVRAMFDAYFGAYDDQNVSRVATWMGREGWGAESGNIERYGGAYALAKGEYQALRKSVETRAYNRSLDGMVNELDQLLYRGRQVVVSFARSVFEHTKVHRPLYRLGVLCTKCAL